MSVFRFLSAFPEASARSAESSRASDAREEARAANREVAELRFQLDRLQDDLRGNVDRCQTACWRGRR